MQLPEDMVTEILVKLSVKSLLRLSLVCKSWHDLIIRNPYFGKKHLINNPNYKNIDPNLIFLTRLQSSDSSMHEDILLADSPLPLVSRTTKDFKVVGSCNGIICLVGLGGLHEFSLYNPITRETLVHRPHNITFDGSRPKLGFGFDMSNDDYKVVQIVKNRVEIYRFRTNTWSELDQLGLKLEDYIFQVNIGQQGVFVSGFFHWRVEKKSSHGGKRANILAFDFQNETFGEIEYPNLLNEHIWCMSVLDDSLAVCSFNHASSKHDIWVMREYGKTESWTKKFSVASPASGWNIAVAFWGHSTNLVIVYLLSFSGEKQSATYFVNAQKDEGRIFFTQYLYFSGVVFRPTLTSFSSNQRNKA